jgi:hypothetical protein
VNAAKGPAPHAARLPEEHIMFEIAVERENNPRAMANTGLNTTSSGYWENIKC